MTLRQRLRWYLQRRRYRRAALAQRRTTAPGRWDR